MKCGSGGSADADEEEEEEEEEAEEAALALVAAAACASDSKCAFQLSVSCLKFGSESSADWSAAELLAPMPMTLGSNGADLVRSKKKGGIYPLTSIVECTGPC